MGKGKPEKSSMTEAQRRVFLKRSNAQPWAPAWELLKWQASLVAGKRFERMKEVCYGEWDNRGTWEDYCASLRLLSISLKWNQQGGRGGSSSPEVLPDKRDQWGTKEWRAFSGEKFELRQLGWIRRNWWQEGTNEYREMGGGVKESKVLMSHKYLPISINIFLCHAFNCSIKYSILDIIKLNVI